MEAGAARKAALELLERLDLADSGEDAGRQAVQGHGAEGPASPPRWSIHPRLLLLDEPFSGLDPVNQGVLEELIDEAARGGATVIFSTHVMQHAERLCDRLLLLATRPEGVRRHAGRSARARCPAA